MWQAPLSSRRRTSRTLSGKQGSHLGGNACSSPSTIETLSSEAAAGLYVGYFLRMADRTRNFAWREEVAGAPAWVVHKGCTPAFPAQRGFVGGSIRDDAVILEGVAGPEANAMLASTIHGAGRGMSRKAAFHQFRRAEIEGWLQQRGMRLGGGDLDESPMAYRRLPEVLARHAGSVRILHQLQPIGIVMDGLE